MKYRFLILLFPVIFFILVACNKNGTPKPDSSGLFIKFYGSSKNDSGYAVKPVPDGYIIVGTVAAPNTIYKDVYVVKVDLNGNKVWDKKFGGAYDDGGRDVSVDANGNYIIVGYTRNIKDSSDVLIIKVDPLGNKIDSNSFGIPEVSEEGYGVTLTSDGNILVSGSISDNSGSYDMYLLKTDIKTQIWTRKLGLIDKINTIGKVRETSDGGLVITGTVVRNGFLNMRIIKADAYANIKWDYSIGQFSGQNLTGADIQQNSDGSFTAVGSVYGSNAGSRNILIVKTDANGSLIWQKNLGEFGDQVAYSLCNTSDGGYGLAGYNQPSIGNKNYYLIKTDADGNQQWSQTYGGEGSNIANQLLQTKDNGFLIIGNFEIANNTVLGLVKTNSTGDINNK